MNSIDFAARIQLLCMKYQGSVTSWGRTPTHNKNVGGVVDSYHLLWLGIDVVFDSNVNLATLQADSKKLGISVEWDKDHYHFQII